MNIIDLLKKYSIPARQADLTAGQWIRSFTTWVFNLARNIIVLGGLKFIAEKTSSPYAYGAFWICFLVLMMFIGSYWQSFYLKVFENHSNGRWAVFADGFVNLVFSLTLVFGSNMVMMATTEALARVR
jgi:hypothetical protein